MDALWEDKAINLCPSFLMTESRLSITNWNRSWFDLGGTVPDASVYEQIMQHYAEPHRHYHTLQHLEECLDLLSAIQLLNQDRAEIEIALWFHDAVYEPRRHDNEVQSAKWAANVMQSLGLEADVSLKIQALILATRHDVIVQSLSAQILVDVDLAILGASTARFDEYERQVRQEYEWVPEEDFHNARRHILNQFLARPWIYSTKYFQDRLEDSARANLMRSVSNHGH
jgi:predicted metal-dependent HD superfamily phosphohydrolase